MVKLQTYAALSFVAALAVIYHAFHSRGQFYPATVYLSTSKISVVILLNMGLVCMCILWQLVKKIFLGSLREAEVETLNEQAWREIMELLFTITIFRQDFSVMFLSMVTLLLLIKSLHWLAQKRVEYLETTPSVPKLSHVRIVSFMTFLLLIDSIILYNSTKYLIETRKDSVSLFFTFEFMVLATTTVATVVKYMFYISDVLMEGQWESKAVFTFYLELIRDLLHLTLCMCFFLIIFVNYSVPVHMIRELYETFRNFRRRVADFLRYRKITSNMHNRFPEATPEELNASDATCIICREDMITAKKLVCGHLFHVYCLRSWLERQSTCPTCRAPVVPPENGISPPASVAGGNLQGNSTAVTSSQGSAADGDTNDNISRHQARLQAAASAALLYEKSFVYPSPKNLMSPGYSLFPRTFGDPANRAMTNDGGIVVSGQSQQFQFGNSAFSNIPQYEFVPSQLLRVNEQFMVGSASASDSVHQKLLNQQIEFLRSQLQILQMQNGEKTAGTESTVSHRDSSDVKGKSVSLSVVGSSES